MIDWKDDGSSASNPHPDAWDETTLREVAGRLIYTSYPGGNRKQELIDSPARLVEIAGKMGADEDQLAEALALLD